MIKQLIVKTIKKKYFKNFSEIKEIVWIARVRSANTNEIVKSIFFILHLILLFFQLLLKKIVKALFITLNYSNNFTVIYPKGEKISLKAVPIEYQTWLFKNTPGKVELQKHKEDILLFSIKPLISILMPVYNTPIDYLKEAIESVISQVYENWELCIVDDNSSKIEVRNVLKEYEIKDKRIKLHFREKNGHISASSNTALEMAKGEFVSLFDHDDLLTPDALYYVVRQINLTPNADLIYTDEDKINEQGFYLEPYFKPDWAPESLLSRNYITHFTTLRTTLIKSIGGFRLGFEGSQDYDLVLRATEKTNNIYHISRILYHWRIHEMSTSSGSAAKPYAFDAGELALNEALQRRGVEGKASKICDMPGFYDFKYYIKGLPLVSIVIVSKDFKSLKDCLFSIFSNSKYSNYEVVIATNDPISTKNLLAKSGLNLNSNTKLYAKEKDVIDNRNRMVENCKGEFLVFMDPDVSIKDEQWLESMLGFAQKSDIGVVGTKLLNRNNSIYHAGIILGVNGIASNAFEGIINNSSYYIFQTELINNYSAVSGRLMMCRKNLFKEVGGFDNNYSDYLTAINFCLRVKERNLRVVCLPRNRIYYQGNENSNYNYKETILFVESWKKYIEKDPFYNSNLTKKSSDYRLDLSTL